MTRVARARTSRSSSTGASATPRSTCPPPGSLSLTLAALVTETTRRRSIRARRATELVLDGAPRRRRDRPRHRRFSISCARAPSITRARASPARNSFPTASGLASSASGFAALALAATRAAGLDAVAARAVDARAPRLGLGRALDLRRLRAHARAATRADGSDAFAAPIDGDARRSRAHGDRDRRRRRAEDARLARRDGAHAPRRRRSTRAGSRRSRATSPPPRPRSRARDLPRSASVAEATRSRMHASAIAARPGDHLLAAGDARALAAVRELRATGVAGVGDDGRRPARQGAAPRRRRAPSRERSRRRPACSDDDQPRPAGRRQWCEDDDAPSDRDGTPGQAHPHRRVRRARRRAGARRRGQSPRRATRRRGPRGSSAFLIAVADEIASARRRRTLPRARRSIVVDNSRVLLGAQKLGLGSSAAVTVAATALALAADAIPDRSRRCSIARPHAQRERARVGARRGAAHGAASQRAGRGSGADVAAAVYGGVIALARRTRDGERATIRRGRRSARRDRRGPPTSRCCRSSPARRPTPRRSSRGRRAHARARPRGGQCRARRDRPGVARRLPGLRDAAPEIAATRCSRRSRSPHGDRPAAAATGVALVPPGAAARAALSASSGGTAKTTGAGGGDIGIAVIPATEDVTLARRLLIEAGCQPRAAVDHDRRGLAAGRTVETHPVHGGVPPLRLLSARRRRAPAPGPRGLGLREAGSRRSTPARCRSRSPTG